MTQYSEPDLGTVSFLIERNLRYLQPQVTDDYVEKVVKLVIGELVDEGVRVTLDTPIDPELDIASYYKIQALLATGKGKSDQ